MNKQNTAPVNGAETGKSNPASAHILATAGQVLSKESDALQSLVKALDGDLQNAFLKAVDILFAVQGRVIISGMGKSGHIARKIAATMASTGTPAQFVHPGEASHGDLGMVTDKDVVFAMSNSGETSELSDLVAHTRRFSIPLIGLSGRLGSTLAEASDCALVLPDCVEACPMGLAPTTSTTMMLALGDALAVALLEKKGFSPADFHVLHPGGKLGSKLLKVEDLMHGGADIPLIGQHAMMSDALLEMTKKSMGCIGITDDDGNLAGLITDGDLRRHMQDGLVSMAAGDVMTKGATTLPRTALASEALAIMNGRSITNVFIVEDGKPVGVLHIHDCLRAGIA